MSQQGSGPAPRIATLAGAVMLVVLTGGTVEAGRSQQSGEHGQEPHGFGRQSEPRPETVTVTVGKQYLDSHAGMDWLLGAGYRDLWAEPIDVEVLDLETRAGGLTPVMRVGGLQTLGLALAGEDGRSYTFRSVDKGSPLVLPKGFQDTGVELFTQDQVSSSLPAGDLIAARLAQAAGILHAAGQIVVMPDEARLGEFREAFAGTVGVFYEFPTAGSFGSIDVYGDDDFLERLRAGTDFADSHAFLRARLLDLLIGDWDRHYGQWRWARMPGQSRLQPIPEDRDQAFSQYDGLVMAIARTGGAQMTRFEEQYPAIKHLAFNGSDFDRLLLNDIARSRWLEIAAEFQEALDDETIQAAVMRLPPPYYALRGAELEQILGERRDRLVEYAAVYYEFLNLQVDIHGTDRDEVAEVEGFPDGSLAVSLSFTDATDPHYQRRFRPDETTEVRLYLRDGDDRVVVSGSTDRAITLRVIGGPGTTVIEGSAARGVNFYDDPDGDGLITDLTAAVARGAFSPVAQANFEIQVPGAPYRDWGSTMQPVFVGRWHRDLGLAVGGGIDLTQYGFGKVPWAARQRISAAYAIESNNALLLHEGDFRRAGGGPHFETTAYVSGMEQLRYYGLGNESSSDAPDGFFAVGNRVVEAGGFVAWGELRNPLFRVGPMVRYVDSGGTGGDTLLARESPYGFGQFGQAGIQANVHYDSRLDLPTLSSGFDVDATATYYPKVWDVEDDYGTVEGEVAAHVSLGEPVTVAFLMGGKMTWGDYPYFDAAYLGGENTFTAYAYNRYAGDALLHGGARLRWAFARLRNLVPGDLGLAVRVDVGRVYLDREESGRWHPQVMAGVFYAAFDRLLLVEIGVGRSDDRTIVTFDADLDWLLR